MSPPHPTQTSAISADETPLAMYRITTDSGFAWNMLDAQDRWEIDVRGSAQPDPDALGLVEEAIEDLRFALEFVVQDAGVEPA